MMINKKNIRTACMMAILAAASLHGHAQKTDSLAPLRAFAYVCNAYKKTPLQLEIDFKSTADYITKEEDTATAHGQFFIGAHGAYIRFGELEEVVNDSVAVMISDKQQRMIIFRDAGAVIAKMKTMMGMQPQDSSIMGLSKKFSAVFAPAKQKQSTVILRSRYMLRGTALPKEEINMRYQTASMAPVSVSALKRTLIPLEQGEYAALAAQPAMQNKLVNIADKEWYLVKEQASIFEYKKITYSKKAQLPVTVEERIVKDQDGNYIPAAGYENYMLSYGD